MPGGGGGDARAAFKQVLTFYREPASYAGVAHSFSSPYSEWRDRCRSAPWLHDDTEHPPEALVQSIWQHQRLVRERLITTEGAPVQVLHPGFRSVEGGPDFRSAVIRVGDGPCLTGDVEVDLRPGGWRAHQHHTNPAFANVVLHVVWDGAGGSEGAPPRIVLRRALDAPLGELYRWLGASVAPFPDALLGRCCQPLRRLKPEQTQDLLAQASLVRLRAKASVFEARARQAGWEQSLWEGLFRALGYKHNLWPMQRIAELRPRWGDARDLMVMQARLFGISGLLPKELLHGEPATDAYLRSIWDCWWREREEFVDCLLPASAWRMHGLRPINHPQRRLALGAHWTLDDKLVGRLERWGSSQPGAGEMIEGLLRELQMSTDPFWSWHYTFRSARTRVEQPLLGTARVVDLAMNVVLPWLWSRAAEGRNDALLPELERLYLTCPAAQDNSVLRLARQRLLGAARVPWLKTAAGQQGLIQIVRDFCEHSNSLCEGCKMPEMIAELCRAQSDPAPLTHG